MEPEAADGVRRPAGLWLLTVVLLASPAIHLWRCFSTGVGSTRQPPALGRVYLLCHCASSRRVDATPPRASAILGIRVPVLRDPACDPNPLCASGSSGGDLHPVSFRGAAVPSGRGSAQGDGAAALQAPNVLREGALAHVRFHLR